MTVNEWLKSVTLTNITTFKINKELTNLTALNNIYADLEVVSVDINATVDVLKEEDIKYSYHIDDVEDITELIYVEQELPQGATYINQSVNINTK